MATRPDVFVKESWDELKKVTWPTRAEITRLTVSVLVISAVVGVFLGGIDLILTKALAIIINR